MSISSSGVCINELRESPNTNLQTRRCVSAASTQQERKVSPRKLVGFKSLENVLRSPKEELVSPRSIKSRVSKLTKNNRKSTNYAEKFSNISPRHFDVVESDRRVLPYTSKKEERFDRELRKFLNTKIMSEEYPKVVVKDILCIAESIFEKYIIRKLSVNQNRSICTFKTLVDQVVDEGNKEVVARGEPLSTLIKSIKMLKADLENYLFLIVQSKSQWSEAFFNQLCNVCSYFDTLQSHICIPDTNIVKVISDFFEKDIDARALSILYKLISGGKEEPTKFLQILKSIYDGQYKAHMETFVEKRMFIRIGMANLKGSLKYEWQENEHSIVKLGEINRDKMIQSIVHDGEARISCVSIDKKEVEFTDQEVDKKSRERNFLAMIVRGIVHKMNWSDEKINDAVTKLGSKEPCELDPILWSFTISSWENAEQMIRQHFDGLFNDSFIAVGSSSIECHLDLIDGIDDFKVTSTKTYTIYPFRSTFEHSKDKHKPLMKVLCSWTLFPKFGKDNKMIWGGVLTIENFEDIVGASRCELCKLVRALEGPKREDLENLLSKKEILDRSKISELYSIENFNNSSISKDDAVSPRSVTSKVRKLAKSDGHLVPRARKLGEISPRFIDDCGFVEKMIAETSKKEAVFDEELSAFLSESISSQNFSKVFEADVMKEVNRVYERCLDKKKDLYLNQSLTSINALINDVIREGDKELKERAELLSLVMDRVKFLQVELEKYLFDTVKSKSRWSEKLLNNLSLLSKFFDYEGEHIRIEGENKLKIFFDVLDKTFDSKTLDVFKTLMSNGNEEANDFFIVLRSIYEGKYNEKIETFVEKMVSIKLGLLNLSNKSFEWKENAGSACKLGKINHDQMIKSLVRDGQIKVTSLTINNKALDLNEKSADKDVRVSNFLSKIVQGIVKSMNWSEDKINETVSNLVNRQPCDLDPILWSFTISSWVNAELLIREQLQCLFTKPYGSIISNAVDCNIYVHEGVDDFRVTTSKSYTIYPLSMLRGHGPNKTNPLMKMFCSWTLFPVMNSDSKSIWGGTLTIDRFEVEKNAPLRQLSSLVSFLLKEFDGNIEKKRVFDFII